MNKRIGALKEKSKIIILFLLTFIITYVILMTCVVTKKYDLKVGDIAKSDIKASREIVDEKATEAAKKNAEDKVGKQYTLKPDVKKTAVDNINSFFSKVIAVKESSLTDDQKMAEIAKADTITLDKEGYAALLSSDKASLSSMQSTLVQAIGDAYENSVSEENVDSAKHIVDGKITSLDCSRALKETLKSIAYSQVKPNLIYDKEKTEEKQKEVYKNTATVLIKKNQTIVKDGEPVTQEQLEILKSMGLLNDSKFDFLMYIALAAFVLIVLVLQYLYIYRHDKKTYEDVKMLMLISVINILSLVLARVMAIISPFLIPFAFAPMLMTMLVNHKASMIIGIYNLMFIAIAVNFDSEVIVIGMLSVILGSTLLNKIQQRNDILYASVYMALINAAVSLSCGIIISNNNIETLMKCGAAAAGCIIAGVLAIGLLPFFENAFDIVTNVKLLELSNPNNPLLKKLLMEAPGTYHHSVLVANLAEMAAEEVGANATLARIGAYYHDVGKTIRPVFFKENQVGHENPHDDIAPSLSALIITSHVKDGVELAEKNKMPQSIIDIIAQHHGTTLVKYFYITARNNAEDPDSIKEEDYRYMGPIPSSKEAGIIMMADSVEAAVRSIQEPTEEKIKTMVENIIKDKLQSGQLDNCDLTIRDISKVKKCFLKALNGIYHQRIEYPKEKMHKETVKNDLCRQ